MTGEASTPVVRALLHTSVVTALEQIPAGSLPLGPTIAAVSLAELAAGFHETDDTEERARSRDRLQRFEALLAPLPFDATAARAYGRLCAATRARERRPRGASAMDSLIAATALATALANDLPRFTRNPGDFDHLVAVGLEVHPV